MEPVNTLTLHGKSWKDSKVDIDSVRLYLLMVSLSVILLKVLDCSHLNVELWKITQMATFSESLIAINTDTRWYIESYLLDEQI